MYYPEGDEQWRRDIENNLFLLYIFFLHGADINLLMQNTVRVQCRHWQYILHELAIDCLRQTSLKNIAVW